MTLLVLALVVTLTSPAQAARRNLRLLGVFETLCSSGFSPDGITHGRRSLFIASAGAQVPNLTGVFEVTRKGRLVEHRPFSASEERLGFSITRATSGPAAGHFFLASYTGLPDIQVFELDADLNRIRRFSFRGSTAPGDGIAFNHSTRNLAITDVSGELFEITIRGDLVRSFPTPSNIGLTFNVESGTYFAVDFTRVSEFSATDGALIRTFALRPYGVEQAVGIASGQGRLFIADEKDDPNSGGLVWVFKSPKPLS